LQDSQYASDLRIRCAVNRAYYGAFHAAKNRLVSHHNFKPPQGGRGIHRQVIDSVWDLNHNLGDKLEALFDKRVLADYFLDREFLPEKAQRQVSIALRIVDPISKI
jgi:uncharacterized protein (UPF0332 family)